jgi:molybdopterin-containing oxidoreductase family iron-sulfur binding subunit
MHIKDSFPELHRIRKPLKAEQVRERLKDKRGREFWRSLEELSGSEEFEELLHREFPSQTAELGTGTDRRTFLKVMGASLAFAGLTGCVYQPQETIVPYVRQPEEMIPGKALFYATAMPLGGAATGLLVRSNEGRPTKIEGNDLHPGSLGAADVYSQAAILSLYDPDRSENVRSRGEVATYTSFLSEVGTRLEAQRGKQGAGLRFLTETIVSPTLGAQMRDVLRRYPAARWYQWEPVTAGSASLGARLATGDFATAIYDFTQADRVLSLDSNFLECGPASLRYARDFASRRRVSDAPGEHGGATRQAAQAHEGSARPGGTSPESGTAGAPGAASPQGFEAGRGEICRLYAVESSPTNTGVFADHRLPVRPSEFDVVVRAIAAGVGVGLGTDAGAGLKPEHANFVRAVVEDLRQHGGRSIVIAGDEQSPVVHALAHAMNQALGNVGRTVRFIEPVEENPTDQLQDLRTLVGEIDAGAVEMLIILGGNPVYTTPPDLRLDEARMLKVPFTAHLSMYDDETSELCRWHIPETHFLEAWSDARAFDGTVTIMQPLIEPLYGGKSAHEVLAAFGDNPQRSGYDIVREFWQTQGRANPSGAGRAAIATAATAGATTGASGNTGNAGGAAAAQQQSAGGPQPAQGGGQTGAALAQAAGNPAQGTTGSAGGATGGAAGGVTTTGGGANAGDFEQFWRRALHDGVVPNSQRRERTVAINTGFAATLPPPAPPSQGGYEIVFRSDPSVYDGRFANNGWLQELPKPLSKLTWDNAALISPATAEALGVGSRPDAAVQEGGPSRINNYTYKGGEIDAEVLRLRFRGREVTAPVYILPGVPDGTIALHLGYGRWKAGRVGGQRDAQIGTDAYLIRPSDALWGGPGLEVGRTGSTAQLASTQIHFQLEGREHEILHHGTYEEWTHDPTLAHRGDGHGRPETQGEESTPSETMSLYPEYDYSEGARNSRGYKWGMMIDVSTCVGCNACVIACQAENNIPVVGKEQVARSREMHWLRIDAYFRGATSNPGGVYFMPLPCMHCEKAPCEPVCPVHATVHSAEGTNDMIYNRCIGTRYCSNNCPYKVRRFNFYLYQDWNTPSLKMLRNPEVSVRSRGVMEKCTFCIQRIQHAKIEAEKETRKVRDGEVKTACQATCPTEAIVFGDLNDPDSRVSRLAAQKRAYGLLDDLNTQPRTRYLAAVRNPNKALEGKA